MVIVSLSIQTLIRKHDSYNNNYGHHKLLIDQTSTIWFSKVSTDSAENQIVHQCSKFENDNTSTAIQSTARPACMLLL